MQDNWIDDIDEEREILYEERLKEVFTRNGIGAIKIFRAKYWREPYSEDELENYIETGEYGLDKREIFEIEMENKKEGIIGVSINGMLTSEFDDKIFENYCGNIERVGEFRGTREFVVCKCNKCGNIFAEIGYSLLDRKRVCCMDKTVSKGEELIEYLLSNLNLKFETQYDDGCENPKTNRKLPYDFVVEHNNEKFYIEVQGKQHYEAIDYFGGEDSFNGVKYRDKIKRKYAENNGIFIELDYRETDLSLLYDRFNTLFVDKYIYNKRED